jgi:hypothetical protein
MRVNTTTPHSLTSPPPYEDMDDSSETNSIRSTISGTSQDILIPAPSSSDYAAFLEWLRFHFASFTSDEFEHFLLEDMKLLSLQELVDFITTCVPKTLHASIGSRKYDANRQAIIDLKIIWQFIQNTYWNGKGTVGSYNAFLTLRERMSVRNTILFPRSEVYTTPSPVYRPVSSVVDYSMNLTPDSGRMSTENSNRYKASSPRMIFPEPELSRSAHDERSHKSSGSSLYKDRYAERNSHAYVPPHAQSTRSSEHTPMRSGSVTPHKEPWATDSHHSMRSAYSARSVPDKSNSSHKSHIPTADASLHSSRSVKSSTRGVLHHKPPKPRAKLNEKVYWDGYGESFLTFRRAIEGHLLQVGAGYLLDTHFLYHYKLNPSACQVEQTYHHTSDIWLYHKQSCHQIRYDTEYFYGMLVSACRNIASKTIIKHANDRDGIIAWEELRRDFDNDGSKTLRMEALEETISSAYKPNQTGGLAAYLDKFLTAFHELEILGEEIYSDTQKKRTLMKNVRGISGMSHLVQKCRDDFNMMTFDSMAQYLRENSKNVENDPSNRKRIMNTTGEEDTVMSHRSVKDTMALFEATARDTSVYQAYQAFSSRPIRQSLNIPDEIWKAMEPAIQDRVKAIREQVKAKRQNDKPSTTGIPAQYPTIV